jgi:hypothetical protein
MQPTPTATPSNPAVVTDATTGLMWTRAPLDCGRVNHADAVAACSNCRIDGHTDWRLPTAHELFGIVDLSRYDPAIDPARFPDTPSNWFWSSSPDASVPDCAWFVYFYGGNVGLGYRGSNAFVRAVRSVPASQ